MLKERARRLLAETRVMTLATARPGGQPHAVPIWFAWHDGVLYFATMPRTVSGRNLAVQPQAAAVVEWGGQGGDSHAVCMEGTARQLAPGQWPDAVLEQLRAKYAWSLREDPGYVLYALAPERIKSW